ncbi:MAG TPA: methionyl-tRNA formyltransferase [Gammaproteobacteria bacterium]|nr:methionyl-tRNA formyltransferase [Gammaproteobacteria bacterium]
MRVVFAGTPDFSVPVLQALLDSGHSVVGVYSQPDRPAGRGRKQVPGPVKQLALQHAVPVFQPLSLRDAEAQQELAALQPDLMVVVAYGLILPQAVLDLPRLGCVNLHASLLPRWRGAAPIQRAILAGDRMTGVCLMQMEAGLDSGPVLAEVRTEISADDTGGSLHDRLSGLAAQLLAQHLDDLAQGKLTPRVQDEALVTYAAKLDKQEAALDWTQDALQLERQVRAFNPWPVAHTQLEGKTLRVWNARATGDDAAAPPGTVTAAGKAGIDVACGSGSLRLLEIQLPGARRLAAADFLNARSVTGAVLG